MTQSFPIPEELNAVIFRALSRGLELAGAAESCLLRRAYRNPVPPPPQDRDVLYYHLAPEGNSEWTETSLSPSGGPCLFRFLPFRLELAFYGPRAETLAWGIARRMLQDGPDAPRRILRAARIFLLPGPPSPREVWEIWQEAHRLRMDLTLRLRIAAAEADESPSSGLVESAPEVRIHAVL